MFIKILNLFQAVVILYKIGLDSECKILTRTALESFFVLKCIVKDEKYLEMLSNSTKEGRKLLLKDIKRDPHGIYKNLKSEIDKNMIEESTNIIHRDIINPKKWAEMSESYTYYYYAYRQLSQDVHVNLINMDKYIKADKSGDIYDYIILQLPDIKDIKIILGHTANFIMLDTIRCISKYSNIDNEDKIKYFESKIIELDNDLFDKM